MRIPIGEFGYKVATQAPSLGVPKGAFGDAANLVALGEAATKIAGEGIDKHVAEQDRVAREAAADFKVTERAARANSAAASFATYQADSVAQVFEVETLLSEGKIKREQVAEELNSRLYKLRTQHVDGLDNDLRRTVMDNVIRQDVQSLAKLGEAVKRNAAQERGGNFQTLLDQLERVAVTDPQSAIGQANAAFSGEGVALYGAEQATRGALQFRERATATHYTSRINDVKGNPQALRALQSSIRDDANLDPDRKNILLSRVQSEEQHAWAGAASDLEIAVHRGQAGYGQIENAYRDGRITPAKRTELTVHLDNERKRALKAEEGMRAQLARVGGALDGRGFLDFRSSEDRKAVDTFYEQVLLPSVQRKGLDPMAAMQEAVTYSARTGIMPSQVRHVIRGALRAGESKEGAGGLVGKVNKAQAADLLDRLRNANPALLNDFADEDIALGNSIQTYVRAGVPALQAVTMAERNLNVPEAERKARETRYNHDKAAGKNLKKLSSEITGFRLFSTSLPDKVPDGMAGEFERLTKEEFIRSGDLESAQKTSLDIMRRVWGVSNVNGKPQYMKYAPEAVYQIPGEKDGKWISEQLYSEVTKNSIGSGKLDLTLAADSVTARESNPSYLILQRKDGALVPLMDGTGMPLRFRPDYATSAAAAKRKEADDKARIQGEAEMERARADRAVLRGPASQPSGGFATTRGGAATGLQR